MCLNKLKTSVKNNGEKIHGGSDNRQRDIQDMEYFPTSSHVSLLEFRIILSQKIESSRAVENANHFECGTWN